MGLMLRPDHDISVNRNRHALSAESEGFEEARDGARRGDVLSLAIDFNFEALF